MITKNLTLNAKFVCKINSEQTGSRLTLYSKADVSWVWNAHPIGCCTRVGAGVFSSQIGQSQTWPTCAVATAQDLPSPTWALQNQHKFICYLDLLGLTWITLTILILKLSVQRPIWVGTPSIESYILECFSKSPVNGNSELTIRNNACYAKVSKKQVVFFYMLWETLFTSLEWSGNRFKNHKHF
jgi:hypothetical protein